MPEQKIMELDQVETPEGNATVVGFLDEFQAEVRYANRTLRIWPVDRLKKIEGHPSGTVLETTITEPLVEISTDAYRQAREQGLSPAMDPSAYELPEPTEAKQSTLAKMVGSGEPLSKSGKRLTGTARERALARQRRERGEE